MYASEAPEDWSTFVIPTGLRGAEQTIRISAGDRWALREVATFRTFRMERSQAKNDSPVAVRRSPCVHLATEQARST